MTFLEFQPLTLNKKGTIGTIGTIVTFQYAFCTAPTKTTSRHQKHAKWKKWHRACLACLHQVHLFQVHLSGAKIKSILVPLKRETIMIRFIILWDQKWEANSIVSVYMHDEASKQIFNTDWEFHPFFSFFIIFFLLFNLRKSKPSVAKKKASRNLLNQNNLLRKKYKSDRRLWQDYLNQISLILAKILLKVTISLWTWDPLL